MLTAPQNGVEVPGILFYLLDVDWFKRTGNNIRTPKMESKKNICYVSESRSQIFRGRINES